MSASNGRVDDGKTFADQFLASIRTIAEWTPIQSYQCVVLYTCLSIEPSFAVDYRLRIQVSVICAVTHAHTRFQWVFIFFSHFIVVFIFIQMKIYWSIGLDTIFLILGQAYVPLLPNFPLFLFCFVFFLLFRSLASSLTQSQTLPFSYCLLCLSACAHVRKNLNFNLKD